MRRRALLVAISLLVACDEPAPAPTGPAMGSEGGICYGNGTCDEPLTCMGGYCIPLDAPDAGADTSQPSDSTEPDDIAGPADTAGPNDASATEDTSAPADVPTPECEDGQ